MKTPARTLTEWVTDCIVFDPGTGDREFTKTTFARFAAMVEVGAWKIIQTGDTDMITGSIHRATNMDLANMVYEIKADILWLGGKTGVFVPWRMASFENLIELVEHLTNLLDVTKYKKGRELGLDPEEADAAFRRS